MSSGGLLTPKTFWGTNLSSLPWLADDLSWNADDFWDLRIWRVGTIDRRRGFDFLDWQLSEGFGSHRAPVVPIDCQVARCRKLKSRILTEMHSANHKIQDMMYSVSAQTTLGQPQWTAPRPKHPGTPQRTPSWGPPPWTPFQTACLQLYCFIATSYTNENGLGEDINKIISWDKFYSNFSPSFEWSFLLHKYCAFARNCSAKLDGLFKIWVEWGVALVGSPPSLALSIIVSQTTHPPPLCPSDQQL